MIVLALPSLHRSYRLKIELRHKRLHWTADHVPIKITGDIPTTTESNSFPLYTTYERGSTGKLILPNGKNVMLSDELVHAAINELSAKRRAKYSAIWGFGGEVRATRVPQTPAPTPNFHGLPRAPVWKRFHAHVGLQAAAQYGFRAVLEAADLRVESLTFPLL